MKISIAPKNERKDILVISLDEDILKEVHYAVFGRQPKFPAKVESYQEFQSLFNELEYKNAKNYVLKRLSLQSYYSSQLSKLMQERLIQPSTIKRLIDECVVNGYLNDKAWLDNFVGSHIKRYSIRAITTKLYAKGVGKEVIQNLLEQWRDPQEEQRKVKHLLETKYRSKDLKDYKQRQKVISSLSRKGYSFELIQSAIAAMGMADEWSE